MSQGPSFNNPFKPQDEPIEAILVEGESATDSSPLNPSDGSPAGRRPLPEYNVPKPPSLWPILGCGGLIFLVLFLSCGGLIFALMQLEQDNDPLNVSNFPTIFPSLASTAPVPEIDPAHCREVFNGTWPERMDAPILAGVDQALQDLDKANQAEDQQAMREMIDWDARMKRFHSVYRFRPIDSLLAQQLLDLEQEDSLLPFDGTEFKIVKLELVTAQDCFAYTYAQQGDYSNQPIVFHFRLQQETWKFVDSYRAAARTWGAEYNSYGTGPTFGDPAGDSQRELMEALITVNEKIEAGETAEAEELLRQAEDMLGVAQLRDGNYHRIAIAWYYLEKFDEVQRVYQKISNADRYPWVYQLSAMTHEELKEYEQAIEAAQKFQDVVGFQKELTELQVRCLQALEKPGIEKHLLALLEYSPDDFGTINLVLSNMPVEHLPQALEKLSTTPESFKQLPQRAVTCLYSKKVDAFQAIQKFVDEKSPGSEESVLLAMQGLYYEGKLEEAYLKGIESLRNREASSVQENAPPPLFLSVFAEIGLKLESLSELYSATPSPFQSGLLSKATEGILDDEANVDVDDLRELHRENSKIWEGDRLEELYIGLIAEDDQQYFDALQHYQKALKVLESSKEDSGEADDDTEYLLVSLQYLIWKVAVQAGQTLDVYRNAEDQERAFGAMAQTLSNREDAQLLLELCAAHAQNYPDDQSLKLYRLIAQEIAARAVDQKELKNRKLAEVQAKMQALLAEVGEESDMFPDYQLKSRLENIKIELENWRDVIQEADSSGRLFRACIRKLTLTEEEMELLEFLQMFREQHPESRELLEYDLKQLWQNKDYQGYVQRLTPWPSSDYRQGYYAEYQARERYIISQLLLGNSESAFQFADEGDSDHTKFLARIGGSDLAKAKEILESEAGKDLYLTIPPGEDWLRIPAIKEFWEGSRSRQLQVKHPMSAGTLDVGPRYVLLFPNEIPSEQIDSAQDVRKILDQADLKDVEVTELDKNVVTSLSYLLRFGGREAMLTLGSAPYASEKYLRGMTSMKLENSLGNALKSHKTWCALEVIGSQSEHNSVWSKVLFAFQSLSNSPEDKPFLFAIMGNSNILEGELSDDSITKLKRGEAPSKFLSLSHELYWLPYGNVDEQTWFENESPDMRKRMATEFQEGASSGTLLMRNNSGSAVEQIKVQLIKIEHDGWGEFSFVGKTLQASALNPYLKTGSTIRLYSHDIRDWQN